MSPEERARLALRGYNMPESFKAEIECVIAACIRDAVAEHTPRSPLQQAEFDLAASHVNITAIVEELRDRPQGTMTDDEFYQWKKRARYALGQEKLRAARIEIFIKEERARQHHARMEEQNRTKSQQVAAKAQQKVSTASLTQHDYRKLKFVVQLLIEGYALFGRLRTAHPQFGSQIDRYRKKIYAFLQQQYPTSPFITQLNAPMDYSPDDPELIELLDRIFGPDEA